MPISTNQAQTSLKNISAEVISLTPSTVITLFEIDIEDLALARGISLEENEKIFRFHNSIKLTTNSIFFNGLEYIAAPVQAEGFEYNTNGTLPTPKLAITVNEEGILLLALFKSKLRALDDLITAKVTRIRTFAKFLDAVNFPGSAAPEGFSPDPNAELGRDIYYIDRKSNENKSIIEFELVSILDLEGLKLPARVVNTHRCPFHYRGEGCMYESEENRNVTAHGEAAHSFLHLSAPPVANDKDEKIADIIGTSIKPAKEYNPNELYTKGSAVWIEKNNLKYYFVCKVNTATKRPPNLTEWEPDSCSKSIRGCELRHHPLGLTNLPFGGYPGTSQAA